MLIYVHQQSMSIIEDGCLRLQVRSNCPPPRLLEFLAGEMGLAANEAAESVASSKAEEEALLEKVTPLIDL